jgi:hypothetical protein
MEPILSLLCKWKVKISVRHQNLHIKDDASLGAFGLCIRSFALRYQKIIFFATR